MAKRTCSLCGLPSGPCERELRPYGRGGADVCAGCVLGDPERETEAQRQLAKRMLGTRPLLLDPHEEVGPRPMTEREECETAAVVRAVEGKD